MSKVILDTHAIGIGTPQTHTIMLMVIAALVPGIIVYCVFISPLVLLNIAVAVFAAVVLEYLAVSLRGANAIASIRDGSIVLAAVLLALAVPPMLPLWQLLVGVLIMVMLGKHVYGGLGHNPFNPAMVGYAALLVSFPQSMTLWLDASELNKLDASSLWHAKFSADLILSNPHIAWDGITQATPLEHLRGLQRQSLSVDKTEIQQRIQDAGWLWINLAYLTGGLLLLYKKIIQWHIPISVLVGYTLWMLLFSNQTIPTYQAAFSGALMLGAFFIATDPVTAASSRRGQLVYGFGIGTITFVIREYGGYPEGIAFAVLLMNLCVPLIDHFELRPAPPT